MKTFAYIGNVQTSEDTVHQKTLITEYAQAQGLELDHFIDSQDFSPKTTKERRASGIFAHLNKGDTVFVGGLENLGKSLSEIVLVINELLKRNIRLVAIRQEMLIDSQRALPNKETIRLFTLLGEIDAELTETKRQRAAARGKTLGRREGTKMKSKLDGLEKEIEELMGSGVSQLQIAKRMKVSRTALRHFISSRGLGPKERPERKPSESLEKIRKKARWQLSDD